MSEIICACCHCELSEDTSFWFDEDFYCQDCLDDQTYICDHCGRRIWQDDNAGDSDIVLCQHCYDECYTVCEECNRVIHQDMERCKNMDLNVHKTRFCTCGICPKKA